MRAEPQITGTTHNGIYYLSSTSIDCALEAKADKRESDITHYTGQFSGTRLSEQKKTKVRTCRLLGGTDPCRTSPAHSPGAACPGRAPSLGCTPDDRRMDPAACHSTGHGRTGLCFREALEAGNKMKHTHLKKCCPEANILHFIR